MTSDALGWDAIDARLAELYPDLEPKHYGTLHRFALGGPDPLDGVSFYPRDDEPPIWAASLLQNLARYVVSSGNWCAGPARGSAAAAGHRSGPAT